MIRNKPRLAIAWVVLTLALAIHVADEAMNDFLSFYNPLAMSLRDMLLWTWMPTFTFGVWLGGLIVAVSALFSMSWFAFYGARWMAWAAILFGVAMFFNGFLHVAGSIYIQRFLPGTWSAPILLVCSSWLVFESVRQIRR